MGSKFRSDLSPKKVQVLKNWFPSVVIVTGYREMKECTSSADQSIDGLELNGMSSPVGECGSMWLCNEGYHFYLNNLFLKFLSYLVVLSCTVLLHHILQDDISTLSQILNRVDSVKGGQMPLKYKPKLVFSPQLISLE